MGSVSEMTTKVLVCGVLSMHIAQSCEGKDINKRKQEVVQEHSRLYAGIKQKQRRISGQQNLQPL